MRRGSRARGALTVAGRAIALLRLLHDLGEPPGLRLRQRARLDDPDDVADVGRVLGVVRVEAPGTSHHLLVLAVSFHGLYLDDDRLVHRIRDDDAPALLLASALTLRLGEPHDRASLRRLLPHRLGALPPLRAWQALFLRPNPLRGFGRGGLLLRACGFRCLLASLRRDTLLRNLCLGRLLGSLSLGRFFSSLRLRRFFSSLRLGRFFGSLRLGGLRLLRLLLLDFLLLFLGHFYLRSRSCRIVRRRAISRLVNFRRAGFSSAPVADWKRRLKSSRRLSASLRASSSSLRARRSWALVKEARLPLDELCLDRELRAGEPERVLRQGLRDSGQLEHDTTGLHHGNPVLRGALARPHASLGRLLRDGLVREDVDPDLATALDLAGHRDSSCLDLAVRDPA